MHRRVSGRWAASAIVALVALLVAGCGSEDERSSPPTTVAETLAPTTAAPTTTSTPPTTSTTPPTTPATTPPTTTPSFPPSTLPLTEFAEPCVEVPATRDAPMFDEARLDRFGPLGTTPAIEFPIPDGPPLPDGVIPGTAVSATRIPGGMLVQVSASYGNAERVLTAIDHDGSVRWQRCFDGGSGWVIAAAASEGPTEVLLADDRRFDRTQISTFSVISLADGRETGTLAEIIEAADLATPSGPLTTVAAGPGGIGHRSVLLSGDNGATADRPVYLLDLVDMTLSTVPAPPTPTFAVEGTDVVAIGPDDRLIRADTLPDYRSRTTAVFLDGEWETDDDVLADAIPITASPYVPFETTLEGFHSLKATDHTGALVWEREDVMLIDAEGFWFGTVDDVVIAISCIEPIFDGFPSCDAGFRTGGYDLATGATIWERDGFHGSAISGDGHVLATTENGGWELLDATTGQRAQADQSWSAPYHFGTECCGGDTWQRGERHGGLVLTVSDGMVRIFLPQWATHPTTTLELL